MDRVPYEPNGQPPQWTQTPQQPPTAQQSGSVPPPAQLDPSVYQTPYQTPYPAPQQGYQQPSQAPNYGTQEPFPAPNGYMPNPAQPMQEQADVPYRQQGIMPEEISDSKKGYRTPKTGFPTQQKKKRSRAPYIIISLLVLLFGGYAVIRMSAPGEAMYGQVGGATLSSRYTGDALLVRNETVYTQESASQIEYLVEEGQTVQRSTPTCTVYTSGFNAKELTTLQKYRDQIKEYHKTLISANSSGKDTKLTTLDTQVRDLAKETRQLIHGARGSLINQETLLTQALQARQTYLKQKYPDDQKLSRLYDDENTQLQRISSWTKQYAAASDGIVSFYTDGYEEALNMNTYADFTPAEVRSMYNGHIPANSAASSRNTVSIYRLVKNDGWAVLMLCSDTDWTPVTGRTYKLLIESFENTVVDATVESFTRSGGELLVRLTVADADVKNILYIRSCQVQLGENVDSLTVPTRALYSQYGQVGVVIVDEMGNNYWTPVTVISTEGDVSHIVPNNAGYLYEGMTVKLF